MKHILILFLCAFLLTGCGTNTDDYTSAPTSMAETETATSAPETIEAAPTVQAAMEYTLYVPNETLDGFLKYDAQCTELTASVILQALIEAGVLNENTTINEETMESSQLHLDFSEEFSTQLNTLGSTGERYFIGSVVNTFISAYRQAGVETVFITVNGEIIESGHMIYDFPMAFFE